MIDRLAACGDHPAVARIRDGAARRPRLLALLAGALIGFAQPPFGFIPGLLGYALLLFVAEQDLGKRPKRAAFFVGWLAGFAYFFVGCFWIAEAFLVDAKTYGWMAPFAAALLPSGIGLFWGAFMLLYRYVRPAGAWRFLFFAALFSAFEITRGTILSGFPWNPAGATWKAGSAMSQVAAFIGVYGLTFVTVVIFSAPAVIRLKAGWRGLWPVAVALGVWLGGFALGEIRLATTPVTLTGLTVRVIQPAVGQEAKWTLGTFDHLFSDYVEMTQAPPKPGHPVPSVVIWPEGALPMMLEDVLGADTWTAPILTTMLRDKQSLIMGTSRSEKDAHGHTLYRNSMMAAHQAGDKFVIDGFYDKYKLVPFGEFTPFQDILNPLGMKALTHFDDSFTPGDRTHAVQFGTIPRFLPLICYEGIFPSLDMTQYSGSDDPRRPHLIINISNDAWFGPTTGPRQHLNLASYRAIEEGLPMVRSTPTGISVLVDPLGRVVSGSKIDLGQRAFVDLTIPHRSKLTAYSTSRYAFVILLSFFCLICMVFDPLVLRIKKNRLPGFFHR